MGLMAGMSLLSIIEIFVLVLISIIQAVKNHENRNKVWKFSSKSETNRLIKGIKINKISTFIKIFIDSSSIHGLPNTTNKHKSLFEKGFWILFTVISTLICLVMIHDITKRSELNPIEFGIDEKIWTLNDVN